MKHEALTTRSALVAFDPMDDAAMTDCNLCFLEDSILKNDWIHVFELVAQSQLLALRIGWL